MAARYFNASARPGLTGIAILAAVLALCVVLSLALDADYLARQNGSAAQRPVFSRRMDVLPPIVVRPPAVP